MSLPPNEWDNYETDPEEIWQRFSKVVDLVIDGGIGQQQLSTIIDCTEENPIILREGAGAIPASII
jgi:tRNA A37 threonylcarbamoyladenosine synthetase subunit TsaC/SUA5/YrdC